MVKMHGYGTSPAACEADARESHAPNTVKQIAIAFGIIALALVAACALISTAKFTNETELFGIGSGEEQEADNAALATFKTFNGQDDYVKETLGAEYYVEEFEKLAESEEITKAVDEVKNAIKEAQEEHKILEIFAKGADAPLA